MIHQKVYKKVTFNCQDLLKKAKQMNIADSFCHHHLTAMMIQEKDIQKHRMHKKKSSSGKNCIYTSPVIKTNQSQELQVRNHKSSHSEAFSKNGVLRNFAKFTGKLLCQSLLFNKVTGLGNRPTSSDNVICNSAIYADDTNLYSKCDQASDLWQQLELASELESNLRDTVDWGRKWLVNFKAGKT